MLHHPTTKLAALAAFGWIIVAQPAPAQHAAMPAAGATQRLPVPALATNQLHQASEALRAGEFTVARDHLERAETALLNARRDGEIGFVMPIDELATARAAVAGRDARAAENALAAARERLARRS